MSKSSITVGQYISGKSILHQVEPRVKLISTFLIAIVLFSVQTWQAVGVSSLFVVSLMLLSRVSIVAMIASLRMVAVFLIIFSVFQVSAVREGAVLFTIGSFPIYQEGFWEAGLVFWRTMLLFLLAILLTATTKPFQITNAIERLLGPLKRIRVPVSDIALMMSIALRFIPILKNELFLIRRAQDARGFYTNKKLISKRITSFIPILVPLFVRSLKRLKILLKQWRQEGIKSNGKRTIWKQTNWAFSDTLALSVSVGTACLIMWL
ncbi:LOW QUALITY PROTEIN: transmembrane component of general energizing module of ECF transporters [Bacillus sp. JCM 19046]|nr:LOW QUALITY PROTEIN: transmembrane component of general energizing module of ECF transporters [Bacillus sp. JCM 19046]